MANKNISHLTLDPLPQTGDYLPTWDISSNSTKRILINSLVALTPEQALQIPVTGAVSGARNVGVGDGEIYYRNQSGVLEFKTIKAGGNITVVNNSGDITINAADQGGGLTTAQNIGDGAGTILSGVQETTLNLKTIKAGSGIYIENNSEQVVVHSTGNTSNAAIGYAITNGSGNMYQLAAIDNGDVPATQAPTFHEVLFDYGSPTLSIPAGNAVYMFDFMFGYTKGSNAMTDIWVQFYDTAADAPLHASTVPITLSDMSNHSAGSKSIRVIQSVTGPTTIQVLAAYSGSLGSNPTYPYIWSTGTSFSYLKLQDL